MKNEHQTVVNILETIMMPSYENDEPVVWDYCKTGDIDDYDTKENYYYDMIQTARDYVYTELGYRKRFALMENLKKVCISFVYSIILNAFFF